MAGEDTDIVVALLVSGRIMPYSKSDMSMERDADLKPHSLGAGRDINICKMLPCSRCS